MEIKINKRNIIKRLFTKFVQQLCTAMPGWQGDWEIECSSFLTFMEREAEKRNELREI